MARRKGPTKMDGVRQALRAGVVKPTEIVKFAKANGITISSGQVSNYKSLLKNENLVPNSPTIAVQAPKRRGRPKKVVVAPKPVAAASNGVAFGYADKLAQLKILVREFGLDEIKKLADVLA